MIETLLQQWVPNNLPGNLSLAVLTVIALYLLVKGADWLVDAAVDLAEDFGLPKLIIGATIVSLGTTSPETAVSVLAALQGKPGLAIGNGVGSVICDLALILGLSITLGRIPIRRQLLNKQAWVVLAAAIVLCLMAYLSPTGRLERWMGIILVAGLVGYLYMSYRWARQSGLPEVVGDEAATHEHGRGILASLGWMVLGLALLISASDLLIPTVSMAAGRMGIPQAVIAASIVALGTSMPELMTALTSLRKGHPDLILGNVIGADVLNILFVIGASACAVPLKIEPVFFWVQAPFMLGLLVLFRIFVWTTREHFKHFQGALLLLGYVLFMVIQYLFGRGG